MGMLPLLFFLFFLFTSADGDEQTKALDDLRETIPLRIAVTGYIFFAILAVVVIPLMFPQLKWYFVLVAYFMAPSLAFCNAYGAGTVYTGGIVRERERNGGSLGRVWYRQSCSFCCLHSDARSQNNLFQSNVSEPKHRHSDRLHHGASQFLPVLQGFDVGSLYEEYKAPYAIIYRDLAIQGVGALPQHCLQLCYGFFSFAVVVNMVKDLCPPNIGKWMPLPICMAGSLLGGAYVTVDMCLRTLIVYLWYKLDAK